MKKISIKSLEKKIKRKSKSLLKKQKEKRKRIDLTPHLKQPKKTLAISKYIRNKKFIKTSNLEKTFEDYVMKSIGYKYETQYRVLTKFFDFYIPEVKLLVEVDGDYWHGNTKKPLNKMQKKNIYNDFVKNKIAKLNRLHLIRFTESDINKNIKRCRSKLLQKILILKNK